MYDTRVGTFTPSGSAEEEPFAPRERESLARILEVEDAIELVPLASDDSDEPDALGVAVRTQMRDNLALGETLVSFGLMDAKELAKVERAQRHEGDVVESLFVAGAIRSRLGDILLRERQITASQLERALEIQRTQGGLLGEILVERGWIVPQSLRQALALQDRGGD